MSYKWCGEESAVFQFMIHGIFAEMLQKNSWDFRQASGTSSLELITGTHEWDKLNQRSTEQSEILY
jgi:hypothetical protein